MLQMKNKINPQRKNINKMEISNLSDRMFRIMVTTILTKLWRMNAMKTTKRQTI